MKLTITTEKGKECIHFTGTPEELDALGDMFKLKSKMKNNLHAVYTGANVKIQINSVVSSEFIENSSVMISKNEII